MLRVRLRVRARVRIRVRVRLRLRVKVRVRVRAKVRAVHAGLLELQLGLVCAQRRGKRGALVCRRAA